MADGPGRPTKYKPEYCDRVVELGRDGYTVVEIAAELDVAKKTLYNWQDEHPEFLHAIVRARNLAEAWWASQGREGVWSREFNASAYRLQMMNRFGWGEKSEHEHSGQVSHEHDHDIPYERISNALAALAGSSEAPTNGRPADEGRPVELGDGDPRRSHP